MCNQLIETLKGIGRIKAEALRKLGIFTIEDLLSYYPRDYLDYSKTVLITELRHGENVSVHVRIVQKPTVSRFRGMTMISCKVTDGIGYIYLKWYNQPYIRNTVTEGEEVYACGKADCLHGKSIINPKIYRNLPGIFPVYTLAKPLNQQTFRNAVGCALSRYEQDKSDLLPEEMREKYGLIPADIARKNIHFPESQQLLSEAKKRIRFEQILFYLLAVENKKSNRREKNGIAFDVHGLSEQFMQLIPYSLTNAQTRVIKEIEDDLSSNISMNRLLEGDVGSGKTLIAVYALLAAERSGYQGVMLAPTDILAHQHYETLKNYFDGRVCLLSGSLKKSERKDVLDGLRNGKYSIAVGTHALLEPDVQFKQLGLVITDEQHRFGVSQRASLEQKGTSPNVLVMSATPIPRTLTMILYGDLDVSIIDELPAGRHHVKTSYIPREKRMDMYRYAVRMAEEKGIQTYVVCPFIEKPEDLSGPSVEEVSEEIKKGFKGLNIGVLHGRMSEQEKSDVMQRFRKGDIQMLFSTTVIEVGIHVDNANIMIIEGADRFGLAQLHQLRGRVGRSSEQAYCFLLSDSESDTVHERLACMVNSTDGFYIAEQDLRLRGPGEIFGTRQHGETSFECTAILTEPELLNDARKAVQEVMQMPNAVNNAIFSAAIRLYEGHFGNIAMN